jgi:hypothetical protein
VTLIFPLLLVALTAPGEVAAATPSGPSSPAPVVLSLQGGEIVPLLGLSRSQAKDGSPGPLQVVYWVGPDAGVLAPLEGREIEQVRARLVFEAFRAWAGANDVSEVVVSIVAGLPGEPGRVLDVPWKRTGGTTWAKRKPTVAEITLPRFPIPSRVGAPDKELQAATQAAALASLSGRAGGGPAPSRTPIAWVHPERSTSPVPEGTEVLVRFLTVKEGVEGVEDVTVRMGADGVWLGR